MKQHVTKEQTREIEYDKRDKFFKLCIKHGYVLGGTPEIYHFLTIGTMIEILGDKIVKIEPYKIRENKITEWAVCTSGHTLKESADRHITPDGRTWYMFAELCDCFFEAIKAIL